MVLRKDELEAQMRDEHQLIQDGILKDDSPLDVSVDFQKLCNACRIGDLKGCQEAVASGVNINARDVFDYTPLILASLCGHYEVVQFLLEAGALCERDTFQGERCLYNALNKRIRNLLLQYDYSKSTDPLQPLASHITALLTRQTPKTSDICLTAASEVWNLHKFVLSARSPYFHKKLTTSPETTVWKLASTIPPESFQIAIRYLYLGDVPADLGLSSRSFVTEEEVLKGIDRVSKQLEIESLWDGILAGSDRRIARQRHQDEVKRGRDQIETWYRNNVLKHKISVAQSKASAVKWSRENSIFADVLLRADEGRMGETEYEDETSRMENAIEPLSGIPIGPSATSLSLPPSQTPKNSILFPAHRAMLSRSEYFQTMFASSFKEAQVTDYLQIIKVDCAPEVLEIVLNFIYTEQTHIPIDLALDVLFVADMLLIDRLKAKAATVISTVGMGTGTLVDRTYLENGEDQQIEVEPINVYDVIRAAWDLKVQRLEEFSARYLAFRLEHYIDEEDFEELIKESASRIRNRQETDTIELLDDIRHYLNDRFRLRFEDSGLEVMLSEEENQEGGVQAGSDEEGLDRSTLQESNAPDSVSKPYPNGQIRTLDGEVAGDEFAADAINYQVLLEKIDRLLDKLKLDA
ncbi:uncharacterized protein L3040_000215 [Drepanopeziza brunnea f. sp. 'multigermtubi']|uniref:BTB/POZ domain containing protein n=1 Tax=Marssonina brunnea f. sp. multigermtubi (strain MB_m1) TaxID=1072389 RepID=K1WQT3_MARBU|nr:BTB/POZ domain containing protein [Drepanopeziza brunnea f. sp. 'multigermtubi' MB_m1]EKD14692.1 BTB/POZ domain containing protein [Drepanopeziza brunnea f. sp. 'multigermtubi' MB_m1]KAJ5053925.1 hypothetical protein L3040_000215 [Drepanopeziza brunnea f. sp. 'multigermtubi']